MDLLGQIPAFGGSLLGYVIPFLIVLTIVVFFHELGHYLVARWCNVKVLAFSVGFGPELFGRDDKHGTRWKVCAIPLGGYVKFAGDENAASTPDFEALKHLDDDQQKTTFHTKPVGQRAAVVAAGPIANFILALVIFAGGFMTVGRPILQAKVDSVAPESAAEEAGFMPGDIILTIEGRAIESFSDMQRIVSINADNPLAVEVERDGAVVGLTATPRARVVDDNFGGTQRIGFLGITRATDAEAINYRRYNPVEAVGMASGEVYFIVYRTVTYLGGLIIGRESADQLGGPIRIAQVSGEVAEIGVVALLQLAAILSVSIGLLNLFPVPMLDGGHLVYYAVEAVRGRPLSERTQEYGFRIGLALVLMLMVFATWNDISRLL